MPYYPELHAFTHWSFEIVAVSTLQIPLSVQRALGLLLALREYLKGVEFTAAGRPTGARDRLSVISILKNAGDMGVQEPPCRSVVN